MIDPSLIRHVPRTVLLWFQLKVIFFLYVLPVVTGFVAIAAYQIYARTAMAGGGRGAKSKLALFLVSGSAATLTLFGWMLMTRNLATIPLYGCGVGLANVVMSQIYAVTLPRHAVLRVRLPKIIWRGDAAAVKRLNEAIAASRGNGGQ